MLHFVNPFHYDDIKIEDQWWEGLGSIPVIDNNSYSSPWGSEIGNQAKRTMEFVSLNSVYKWMPVRVVQSIDRIWLLSVQAIHSCGLCRKLWYSIILWLFWWQNDSLCTLVSEKHSLEKQMVFYTLNNKPKKKIICCIDRLPFHSKFRSSGIYHSSERPNAFRLSKNVCDFNYMMQLV